MTQYKKMKASSNKIMLEAVDEQLELLAELIVGFLNAVDDEEDLYKLVENLCTYDDIIMEKLSFTIDSHLMDKDIKDTTPIPSGSRYAH